jgi:O-antigen ligase
VIAFAVLSGPLPKLGVIVLALLAAIVILGREPATRAWAMLGALVLSPVLLLADIWRSPQLGIVHRHPLETAVGAAVILAAVVAFAVLLARRPRLLGPVAMLALPFRVPIGAANATANLLVPLYFVVAAACLAWLGPVLWRSRAGGSPVMGAPGDQRPIRTPHLFEKVLAGYVVLYALQAIYSPDFEKALQNVVFFYVPFALLLRLLRDLQWDRRLIVRCLGVTVFLALVFSCIGFIEYDTKTLFLNPRVIAANDLHQYFTVNSVFFDPDIFGRYLSLVMILVAAVLLYDRRPKVQIGASLVLAVLWGGLVLTLSRSSLGALLLGLAVLAALRWKVWPVVGALVAVIVAGLIALAVSPKTFGLNQGLNGASSGRANLITGGGRMLAQRPVWGYGSGAFSYQYRKENPRISATLSDSHTIPVTIAAEQGVIGEVVYLVLVIGAILTLLRGVRAEPVRAAIAAAFLGLVLHTMLYADFLEDPVTWTLLAIGSALAIRDLEARQAIEAEGRSRRRAVARA